MEKIFRQEQEDEDKGVQKVKNDKKMQKVKNDKMQKVKGRGYRGVERDRKEKIKRYTKKMVMIKKCGE